MRWLSLLLGIALALSFALALLTRLPSKVLAQDQQPAAQQAPAPPVSPEQNPPTEVTPPTQAPAQEPSPPVPSGPVIVLDPAHGGTDAGARGDGGVTEKEIVLQLARAVRANLERQGYRVILTRSDDSNPSYDDRAAIANGYHDAIFISLHVSSTGPAGTARAYYQRFSTQAASSPDVNGAEAKAAQPGGLIAWSDAQKNYVGTSERFADLVQHELAQLFSGSPTSASGAPVCALRSVAGPAIAIEISSISGSSQDALAASATPVGAAILRAIVALRQTNVAAK